MTTLIKATLERFRAERQELYTAIAAAASELHAANGCSYCRPHSHEPFREHNAYTFYADDVVDNESSFELRIRDDYDRDRETIHYLELPDELLTDPDAFAAALAAARAEHDAAAARAAAKEEAKLTAKERDERATLRRLAERYPEELSAGSAS